MAIAAASPIDGAYPNWSKVVPKETKLGEKGHPFDFNPEYLADFQQISKAAGLGEPACSIVQANETDPALVFIANVPEFVGVLMPLRSDHRRSPPDWLKWE